MELRGKIEMPRESINLEFDPEIDEAVVVVAELHVAARSNQRNTIFPFSQRHPNHLR